jgi:tetratricopeptide (TPR) repeat protein
LCQTDDFFKSKVLLHRGALLDKEGKSEEAKKDFDKAVHYNPDLLFKLFFEEKIIEARTKKSSNEKRPREESSDENFCSPDSKRRCIDLTSLF